MRRAAVLLLASLALAQPACSSDDTVADNSDYGPPAKGGSSGKAGAGGQAGKAGAGGGQGGSSGKQSGGSSSGGSGQGGSPFGGGGSPSGGSGQGGSAPAGAGGAASAGASAGAGGGAGGAGGSPFGGGGSGQAASGGSGQAGTGGSGQAGSGGTGGPSGSNGSGGPGPGTSQLSFSGGAFSMYVPPTYAGQPTPLLVLLHGQGDTGQNFLTYWRSKSLAPDVLTAAPDDNTDTNTVALYDYLLTQYNVDKTRGYVFGHSQGGAYAAFLLFVPSNADRFAAIVLNSSGLAKNPSGIANATPASPAVAICIDAKDPNNTGSLDGSTDYHIMENFAQLMQQKGYDTQLTLHDQGHTIPMPQTVDVLAWAFSHAKP